MLQFIAIDGIDTDGGGFTIRKYINIGNGHIASIEFIYEHGDGSDPILGQPIGEPEWCRLYFIYHEDIALTIAEGKRLCKRFALDQGDSFLADVEIAEIK